MINKFQISNFKFQIFSLFFLIFIFLYPIPYTLYPSYASEASSSATLSGQLKVKLDELKKEIASKAAKLKQEVSLKLQNKAFVGFLKTKEDSPLTIKTETGVKKINFNQDTVFVSSGKQKFSRETLTKESYIAALGDIDDSGILNARKIILLSPDQNVKVSLWGQIQSLTSNSFTIKTRDLKKETIYFDNADIKKGEETASGSDLDQGSFVIVTAVKNNDIYDADFIYIIPKGAILKPRKIATPSAKLATQSAKTASSSAKAK